MGLDFNRKTCLYKAFDKDGAVLYVGISSQPLARIKSHRKKEWFPLAEKFEMTWFQDRLLAMTAERNAVASLNPKFNVLMSRNFRRVGRERGKYIPISGQANV